ncbi:hypothetical protein [Fischerella thermalis]|uniref:hypothetical protein n=1 Tax=Fischerella thermalis TaxID=372787 RepID=UPI00307FCC89
MHRLPTQNEFNVLLVGGWWLVVGCWWLFTTPHHPITPSPHLPISPSPHLPLPIFHFQ